MVLTQSLDTRTKISINETIDPLYLERKKNIGIRSLLVFKRFTRFVDDDFLTVGGMVAVGDRTAYFGSYSYH